MAYIEYGGGKVNEIIKYKNKGDMAELVIKYSGELEKAAAQIGAQTEILSDSYAIVTLPASNIDELYNLPQTEYIELPKRMYFMRLPSLQKACIFNNNKFGGISLDGEGTLIGIIDSGIDIFNGDFINDDGTTRIFAILDLSKSGSVTVYSRLDINNFLNGSEVTDFSDVLGHGTAVAGICAGNGRSSGLQGIAPECELVIVKLGTGDGYSLSTDIMRGLKFIKDTAETVNKPVAINISYGTNDGAHDGHSLLESYINSVADSTVCSICIAAGNEGAAGHHYSGRLSDNKPIAFNAGGNINNLYMSIWKSFADDVSLVITAPNGEKSGFISYNTRLSLEGVVIDVVFSLPMPYEKDTEIYINISGEKQIPPGIWRLELIPRNVTDGRFDIWLPVTEAVGRETAFTEPDDDITLTLPSGALKAIAVGGYDQISEKVLGFSGRGYTRESDYIKPDIAAPAYNVQSALTGGGTDVYTGTSFAAPHVTGAAALIMQWGIVSGRDKFMYGERLKAFLLKGASRFTDNTYPNREVGFGRLCFERTMRLIEESRQLYFAQRINSVSVADAALSDDYYDFVRRQNSYIFDIEKNDNMISCIIDDNYYVLYIKKSYYDENKTMLINTYGIRQPYLMGLTDIETAFEKSGINTVQNQPYLNLHGSGIIIAFIDTGINYRDEDFIYEDGTTKIKYIWDQSLPSRNSGLCFGQEFTENEINRALADELEVNTVDEIGHGTAMAKIAAGRNGAAPDADIVAVKLKQAKRYLRNEAFVGDDVPAYASSDLMLGVNYVYKKADELNKPVVICIGMGTNQGGHGGQSALEEYFSAVARRYSVCLCVPAGNEGIAAHHASVTFAADDKFKEVEINVDENEDGINIYIWNFILNITAVEIVSPLREVVSRVQPIANYENTYVLPRGGGSVNIKYFIPEDIASDQYTRIRISAPAAGRWIIRLYNENGSDGIVHLWLPLTQFLKGNTVFTNPSSAVTITTPASANAVLTVGGYNSADNSIYPPTGRGPTRFYNSKPHICAPAVNINGRSGTSIACAVASGAAALMMEWFILKNGIYTTNTVTITAQFIIGARQGAEEMYPNNTWGYGTLDLYSSFENL